MAEIESTAASCSVRLMVFKMERHMTAPRKARDSHVLALLMRIHSAAATTSMRPKYLSS
jgi:hypothetical protein